MITSTWTGGSVESVLLERVESPGADAGPFPL